MDIGSQLLVATPGGLALASLGIAVTFVALALLVVWFGLSFFNARFQLAYGGRTGTALIVYYTPGFSQLAAAFGLLTDSVVQIASSLASLAGAHPSALIVALALGSAGAIYYFENPSINQNLQTFHTCSLNDLLDPLKELFNIVRYGAGIGYPVVNFWSFLGWAGFGILRRDLLTCAREADTGVFAAFLAALADIIKEFTAAVIEFFTSEDMLTGRINLIPTMHKVGVAFEQLSDVWDCFCEYLSFLVRDLLLNTDSDSFAAAGDCLFNGLFIRPAQSLAIAIRDGEAPQIDGIAEEAMCFSSAAGGVVEDVVRTILTFINDWLTLVPIVGLSADARATLVNVSGVDVDIAAAYDTAIAQLVHAAERPDVLRTAEAFNLTELIGFHYVLRVAEAPWSRVPVGVINAIVAAVNVTWSWSLLITRRESNMNDLKYFQYGFALDHIRDASVALGQVVGVFDDKLDPAVADLGLIAANAAQMALELFFLGVLINVYEPPDDGNPLGYAIDYCNATDANSLPRTNYRLLYNDSAAWAAVFGCEEDGEADFPLTSAGAVCDKTIAGCIILGAYRFLVEVIDFLEKFACYFSEIIQFRSDATNFGDLNIERMWRPYVHLGDCLRELIFLFDVLGLGDPVNEPCIYSEPGAAVPLLKKSFACSLGNLAQALWLLIGNLAYELLRLLQGLLRFFSKIGSNDFNEFLIAARSVEIPTLTQSVQNLEVALCQVGGILGSLFPYTFSCSSQAPQPLPTYNYPVNKPQQSPVSLALKPAEPVERRTSAYCTFDRSQWAANPPGDGQCNCTAAAAAVEWTTLVGGAGYTEPVTPPNASLVATLLPCLLECASPGQPFPMLVGSTESTSFLNCSDPFLNFKYSLINFTSASALRAYLQLDDNITGVTGGGTFVDPGAGFPPGRFLGEVVTAMLNDRMNRIYNGQAYVVFRPFEGDYVACTNNGTYERMFGIFSYFGDISPLFGQNEISMTTIIDYANHLMIGLATNATGKYFGMATCQYPYSGSLWPDDTSNFLDVARFFLAATQRIIGAFMYEDVDPLLSAGNEMEWQISTEAMHYLLRLYNSAFPNCNQTSEGGAIPNAATCFKLIEQAEPKRPMEVIFNVTNSSSPSAQNVSLEQICTWTSDHYKLPGNASVCDCSDLPALYYQGSNTTGICLLYCLGALNASNFFPFVVGYRQDECEIPEWCNSQAYEFTDIETLQQYGMGATLLSANERGEDIIDNYVPARSTTQVVPEGPLVAEIIAAKLNMYFLKTFHPGLIIYTRSLWDSLYTLDPCAANEDARRIFAGQRVDVVLDVIEKYFIGGSQSYAKQCSYFFHVDTPQYRFCDRLFHKAFPAAPVTKFRFDHSPIILHFLRRFNEFRAGCANATSTDVTINQCFVATTFDSTSLPSRGLPGNTLLDTHDGLPPLSFLAPQYAALTEITVDNIQPCKSTIEGGSNFFCALGRMVAAVLYLVTGVLEQINIAIGSHKKSLWEGGWTLSIAFWDILKQVLLVVWSRLAVVLLTGFTGLDCIMCALSGNLPELPQCHSPLFGLFLPIIQFLAHVGAALISFVIDVVSTVLLVIYYFFSGQFAQLIQAIFQLIISYFLNLLVPLIEGVIGFIFGVICICENFWNIIAGAWFTCTDMGYCGTRKRGAFFTLADASNITFDYQYFAPEWPAEAHRFVWNTSNPCNASMRALAPLAPNHLTRRQGQEASFCLAQLTVFGGESTSMYDHGPMAFSYCEELVADTIADRIPYSQLPSHTRTELTQCVHEYGLVYAYKRATGGRFEWLPTQVLSTRDGGLMNTMLPLAVEFTRALAAHMYQWRDEHYTTDVRQSVDFGAQLTRAYGADRAEWARQGGHPDIAVYAERALTSAHATGLGRKRAGAAAQQQQFQLSARQLRRVSGMAETVKFLTGELNHALPAMLRARFEHASAALPPLPIVLLKDDGTVNSAGVYEAVSTGGHGAVDTPVPALDDDRALRDTLVTAADRSMNAVVQLVDMALTKADDDEQAEPLKKRGLLLLLDNNSTGRPYSLPPRSAIPRLLWEGTRGLLTVMRELWSGRAGANATGNANANASTPVITAVKWELAQPEVPNAPAGVAAALSREMARRRALAWTRFWGEPVLTRFRRRQVALEAWRQRLVAEAATGRRSTPSARLAAAGELARRIVGGDAMARAAVDPGECLTIPEFCEQCKLVADYLGYTLMAMNITIGFYAGGDNVREEATLAYMDQNFREFSETLFNDSRVVVIGNSSDVRFVLSELLTFLDDPVPNKLGISDFEPLVNRTIEFLSKLFGSTDLLDPGLPGVATTHDEPQPLPQPPPPPPRHPLSNATLARLARAGPHALPLNFGGDSHALDFPSIINATIQRLVRPIAAAAAAAEAAQPQQHLFFAAAANFTEARELLFEWFSMVRSTLFTCQWDTELNGFGVRASVGVGVLIATAPLVLMAWLGIAFPALGQLVFSIPGGTLGTIWVSLVLVASSGWSVSCAPALPPILFTVQVPHFVNHVLFSHAGLWLLSGGIEQDEYNATTCYRCDLWESGFFSYAYPPNLGWTSPLDPIVFALRQFDYETLQRLRSPENYPWYFGGLLALEKVQSALTKWDEVDIWQIEREDRTLAAQHWYGFMVTTLVTMLVLPLVSLLLLHGPAVSGFKTLASFFYLSIVTGGAFLIAMAAFFIHIFYAPVESMEADLRNGGGPGAAEEEEEEEVYEDAFELETID